jgi:uncharacterized protein YbjT (DUF2867 family)
MDFTHPLADRWARELAGVDVVINAVGIIRESPAQSFDALHTRGPAALFEAASAAGVRRIIQISALGAEAGAVSRYHQSKHAADRVLMASDVDWVVVQPSLVYGQGGNSAALFGTLATLPVIPLPGDGLQQVQPVHLDDLAAVIVRLAEDQASLRCVLAVVGPEPVTLRAFLLTLRTALGLGTAPVVRIPRSCMALAARVGAWIPGALLTPETWAMLERGNTAPAAPLTEQLGRPPRPIAQFIGDRASARAAITLGWAAPLLRLSIAAIWLIAGVVSLGLYPVESSIALLTSIGVPAALAPLMLMGAAGLDLALGVWTLLPWRPRGLWTAQILLVLVYTAIITFLLPHLWLEPFGPVAKNLPVLALLLLLRQIEARR